MTTTVYLVRHGAHDQLPTGLNGRMGGVTLSEAGIAQAEAAGRRLAGLKLECILTSPMDRCRQTARHIARACGVFPRVEPALHEIDFGDWSGLSFKELDRDPEWARWNTDRDHVRPPGGETMLEVQCRLSDWLERVRRNAPAAVVAVSHADVIKAAACLALGLTIRAHDRFAVDPGSITTLVMGGWGMKLHSLNEVPR